MRGGPGEYIVTPTRQPAVSGYGYAAEALEALGGQFRSRRPVELAAHPDGRRDGLCVVTSTPRPAGRGCDWLRGVVVRPAGRWPPAGPSDPGSPRTRPSGPRTVPD